VKEFLKSFPDVVKPEILKYGVIFEFRCKAGAKAIMHIEAFLARAMAILK